MSILWYSTKFYSQWQCLLNLKKKFKYNIVKSCTILHCCDLNKFLKNSSYLNCAINSPSISRPQDRKLKIEIYTFWTLSPSANPFSSRCTYVGWTVKIDTEPHQRETSGDPKPRRSIGSLQFADERSSLKSPIRNSRNGKRVHTRRVHQWTIYASNDGLTVG